MNTNKIREHYKKLRDDHDNLIFVEKEITDLLFAISDYILKDEQDCHLDKLPEGFILFREFAESYFFLCAETLRNYVKESDEFRSLCINFKGTWYVNTNRAAEFFYRIPIYKRRMDNILRIQNNCASSNK